MSALRETLFEQFEHLLQMPEVRGIDFHIVITLIMSYTLPII